VRRIGEGGFGVVYKAVHNAKERTEALKVLFSETPIREAYFQNEVRFVAKLRHPNIATLYEARLSAPPLYYAMELVEANRQVLRVAAHAAGGSDQNAAGRCASD
jgi:serine/threonine-protein kinase